MTTNIGTRWKRIERLQADARQAALAEDWQQALTLYKELLTETRATVKDAVNFARTVGDLSDAKVGAILGTSASAVNQQFGTRASLLQQVMSAKYGLDPTPRSSPRPAPEQLVEPHVLYRFFDAAGLLLYIGMTVSLPQRMAQHGVEKPWWAEVASVTVEHFPDRASVHQAEKAAIVVERPRYNVVHAA